VARDARRSGDEDRAAASDLHRASRPRPARGPQGSRSLKYLLKVRVTGKVAKFERADEDALFDLLARELESQIADTRGLGTVGSPLRDYEAIEIVHSRLEIVIRDGPLRRRRGGIDVRRNGDCEAWLGGSRKQLVEPRPGESLPAALRRELDSAR
jgi:hypothetical protein